MGFGVVPFVIGATYSGIGQHRFRSHAPCEPPALDVRFGGTGLSGLALSTSVTAFPAPFDGALFVANPIERKVQAVSVQRDAAGTRTFTLLPPLLESFDARFRPIAVHFGPDDSLYVVDWYNPIISHNEVPRTHPDRDRERTRVWRIRHAAQPAHVHVDATTLDASASIGALRSPQGFTARAAWHQIVDQRRLELVPALRELVRAAVQPLRVRALALWSLEGLGRVDGELARELLADPEPALRRAAVRGYAADEADVRRFLAFAGAARGDVDLETRCETLRALARAASDDSALLQIVLRDVPAPDERDRATCEQDGVVALRGASLAAMRERMWIRIALEGRRAALERWLHDPIPRSAEPRAIAALELGGPLGAEHLARALDQAGRAPCAEELAMCAAHAGAPGVARLLEEQLGSESTRSTALEALLSAPPVELARDVRARVIDAARALADAALVVRVATHFGARELEDELRGWTLDPNAPTALRRDALRALIANGAAPPEFLTAVFDACLPGHELQTDALLGLCSRTDAASLSGALARIGDVAPSSMQSALRQLTSTKPGARALLDLFVRGALDPAHCDERLLEALRASLGDAPELTGLAQQLAPLGREVLVLAGGSEDFARTSLALAPPFTIEAWVRCDPDVSNRDGLLARPPSFDFNFANALPRLWLGPARGDVIVARRPLEADRWTHLALTASETGVLHLYQDGELDVRTDVDPLPTIEGLDVGRTTPGGAALQLLELRIWSVERSARDVALHAASALDEARPAELVLRLPGDPSELSGDARVELRRDTPRLMNGAAQRARAERFERYAQLARRGDAERGRAPFSRICQTCHAIGGQGESVGPPLDGVGARGLESILAAVLEPSSAVESGYRELRVELDDETALSGLLVRAGPESIVLRPTHASGALEERIIPRSRIVRMRWSKLSLMPEGLLEALPERDAGDLLAFLREAR